MRRYGKSYAHPFIVLITLPNEMDQPRIAIAAGRSIGKAVHRNKAKRLLREIMRPLIHQLASGWDIILLARKPMTSASFSEIRSAVEMLLQQAKLLEEKS